ncbi:MAG: SET domain-containing protein-lysine N-methyltransferase [Candidatus Pacebacteria bacterium CG_4_10_14_0_8_um_filter_43_12]|nr:MAG: SET domain-containing protein-lysine N-methyltransferase [Candidatus Pacebacteria bacterium CG_4_10_14_0_8_um_filter_43_12]
MRKHSYLSPKCEANNSSKIHRYGVFAKENIQKGELIALWGGYIITLAELRKLPREILDYDYPVQIYKNFYLGPKSEKDLDDCEMFNHSCHANAGVKGQNILVARRKIKAGEEICFDYETTDTQDLKFTCKCGAKKCRGKINGTSWKNPKFQRSSKGYLSFYIQEKIKKLKKNLPPKSKIR